MSFRKLVVWPVHCESETTTPNESGAPNEDVVQNHLIKVSVKENEVPTEKNSSRASIFATKASYISN